MKRILLPLILLGSLQASHSADILSDWWRGHANFTNWSDITDELKKTLKNQVTSSQKEVLKPDTDGEKDLDYGNGWI